MKRLTTDDKNSIVFSFNTFYAKDREIWIRGGGPAPDYQDVTLVQWIRSAASKHGLSITADDPEYLGEEMYDALQDGDETVEGILALMHLAAVQATEMRERLKPIEEILGDDYDLDRLRALIEDDRDERCVVLPCEAWLELVFGEQEVFFALDEDYEEQKIREITVRNEERFTWYDGWKTVMFNGTDENGLDYEFSPEDIGKTVFLTREAAEAALQRGQIDGIRKG